MPFDATRVLAKPGAVPVGPGSNCDVPMTCAFGRTWGRRVLVALAVVVGALAAPRPASGQG